MRLLAWMMVFSTTIGCWNTRTVYEPPVRTEPDTVPRVLRMRGTAGDGLTPTLIVTTGRGRAEVAAITQTHDTVSEGQVSGCGPWRAVSAEEPIWQCQHRWLGEPPDAYTLLRGLDSLIAAAPAAREPSLWCDGGVHWTLDVEAEGRTWRLQSIFGDGALCWPTDSLGRGYNRRGARLLWGALEGLDATQPDVDAARE